MKVDKMSISFDPTLGDSIRTSAKRAGRGLSRWMAEAAVEKLRREAFDQFLADWEAEHGKLTAKELASARRRLGLPADKIAGRETTSARALTSAREALRVRPGHATGHADSFGPAPV